MAAGRIHEYRVNNRWTGNLGEGTSSYRAYSRDHELSGAGKTAAIPGSSDAMFRGDGARYNPEELLVGAVSACHMLWVLHLCADAGGGRNGICRRILGRDGGARGRIGRVPASGSAASNDDWGCQSNRRCGGATQSGSRVLRLGAIHEFCGGMRAGSDSGAAGTLRNIRVFLVL